MRGLDTQAQKNSLVWDPDYTLSQAKALESTRLPGIDIVTRAQWGADESLRYEENPLWIKFRAKQALSASGSGGVVSEAALKYRAKNTLIENHLRSTFPEEFERSEVVRKQ